MSNRRRLLLNMLTFHISLESLLKLIYYRLITNSLSITLKLTHCLLSLSESAKLRATRAPVPRALRAFMPYVPRALRALVAHMPSCLTCLVPYVLSCLTCLVPYLPRALRALVPHVPRVLRALVPYVSCSLCGFVSLAL